jgi:hypothetical protein
MLSLLRSLCLLYTCLAPSAVYAAAQVAEASRPEGWWWWIGIIGLVSSFVTIFTLFRKPLGWVLARRLNKLYIRKSIIPGVRIPEDFENSSRYFIPPMCQDVDPFAEEDYRAVRAVKQPLFEVLDEALRHTGHNKHIILLADSGMGKTTALLNYCLRHYRRLRRRDFNLKFVPLSDHKADSLIDSIEDKGNTVLVLDALDEDERAVSDHAQRLLSIINATEDFLFVVISCRTQFFSREEEIPKETGIIKIFGRGAGPHQEAVFHLRKIYLSPFSDEQVRKYLKRKYPFRLRDRKLAYEIVSKVPDLTARPMLLAHVEDLVRNGKPFEFSYELYKVMVEEWLNREKGFISEHEVGSFIEFLEMLAVYIHLDSKNRKSEKISRDELKGLALGMDVQIDWQKLSARTLLNRDGEGNLKFAHRSIMECLFINRFFRGNSEPLRADWTERMHVFHWEGMAHTWKEGYPWFNTQPLKHIMSHPNGTGLLMKSFGTCAVNGNGCFKPREWDRFRAGFIACAVYAMKNSGSEVKLLRVKKISCVPLKDEKQVTLEFGGGTVCIFSNDKLTFSALSNQGPFVVSGYRGESADLEVSGGEWMKRLPPQIAHCFSPSGGKEESSAFRITFPSEADIIVTLQTSAHVEEELVEKIMGCFLVLL